MTTRCPRKRGRSNDHSRLAYCELLPSESPADCVAFLRRAVNWYAERGVSIERVLSDNGNGYRSFAWRDACAKLGIQRRYTRPRRPQTNGKAERFIRTMLNGWAYGAIYRSSHERSRALDGWLWNYNHRRRHSALGHQPPASRTNLLGSYN